MEGQKVGLKEEAIELQEKKRTYDFGKVLGKVVLENVTELVVRESGRHRLKTADGKLHIVPVGWIHVEIDASEWTV